MADPTSRRLRAALDEARDPLQRHLTALGVAGPSVWAGPAADPAAPAADPWAELPALHAAVHAAEDPAAQAAALQALVAAVTPFLAALPVAPAATLDALRPDRAALAAVFQPAWVDAGLRAAAVGLPPPGLGVRADQTAVTAWACPAGALGGPLGARFPGGAQRLLEAARPESIWWVWRYHVPGAPGRGLRYDGLVWAPTGWAWVPKVWKLL